MRRRLATPFRSQGGKAMFCEFYCQRKVSIEELREVLKLMENQETTDRFTNTEIDIDGNDAHIHVKIDKDGNILLR